MPRNCDGGEYGSNVLVYRYLDGKFAEIYYKILDGPSGFYHTYLEAFERLILDCARGVAAGTPSRFGSRDHP